MPVRLPLYRSQPKITELNILYALTIANLLTETLVVIFGQNHETLYAKTIFDILGQSDFRCQKIARADFLAE